MQKYIDFHTCPPVPLVVAHRGARGHAPENTLTAAALGYAVQADLWELDANYTKDGKLVVMHDDTLVRTTDVETAFPGRPSYRVCDFTLDEIKSLDAGSWYAGRDQFGRVAAGEIDADTLKSFDGLTVPTLEEALAFTKDNGWYVNVEIKNHSHLIGHETVTKDVLDLIRRLDMVEQVIISSFQHRYLEECRVLCPEMATGALVEHIRPERSGSPVPPAPGQRLPPGSAYPRARRPCRVARCRIRRQRVDRQRHERSQTPRCRRRDRHHYRFSRRLPQGARRMTH